MSDLRPCLWLKGDIAEAARFYEKAGIWALFAVFYSFPETKYKVRRISFFEVQDS